MAERIHVRVDQAVIGDRVGVSGAADVRRRGAGIAVHAVGVMTRVIGRGLSRAGSISALRAIDTENHP